MKKITIVLFIIGLISSCSSDDNNTTNNTILGEWKLVEVRTVNFTTNPTIDYSNDNIIFNFQANGTLSVTGSNNVDYPNGTYNYVFEQDYLGGAPTSGEEMIWLVKIDNTKWTYDLTNGKMTLGTSYIDGLDLVFEKK